MENIESIIGNIYVPKRSIFFHKFHKIPNMMSGIAYIVISAEYINQMILIRFMDPDSNIVNYHTVQPFRGMTPTELFAELEKVE